MALADTRTFDPNLGEITIGAFARIGVRRTEITQQHMADAQFEANLLQVELQGDGVQTYQVTLEKQDLHAGQGTYQLDPNTVFVLDIYIRQNPQVYGVNWDNNNANSQQWINNNQGEKPWTQGSNVQIVPPQNTGTIDRIIIPISRSDYAAIATKYMTGFPTSVWINYQLNPTLNLWPVPNMDIPQGLQYYVQRRPTTAELADGATLQLLYQVYDYYVWALAERLAYIYSPDKVAMIGPRKQQAYLKYLQSTTENTPLSLDVELKSYFRVG
jgi:hypothetical protein